MDHRLDAVAWAVTIVFAAWVTRGLCRMVGDLTRPTDELELGFSYERRPSCG